MKKIYISGKITDLPYEEAYQKFRVSSLKFKGLFIVINPMLLDHTTHEENWEGYMKVCLTALLKCDFIYMLKDWKDSKGATIEYELAKMLKIKVLYE